MVGDRAILMPNVQNWRQEVHEDRPRPLYIQFPMLSWNLWPPQNTSNPYEKAFRDLMPLQVGFCDLKPTVTDPYTIRLLRQEGIQYSQTLSWRPRKGPGSLERAVQGVEVESRVGRAAGMALA